MRKELSKILLQIYDRLHAHFGPTHWWPGESPFEVMVGAVLTQNTSWKNVEKAITSLKEAGQLSARAINALPQAELEKLVRSAGFFRVKSKRLKSLVSHLCEKYDCDIVRMRRQRLESLRQELLSINGVGRETADSILLYALEKPTFVVDAYTRRIFSRHELVPPNIDYDDLKAVFESNLPRDVSLFKEYHGLIVYTGKDFCRKKPRCEVCPLGPDKK